MYEPSLELFRQVRASLVLQGKTFRALAESHGMSMQNARKALTGEWRGPKAADTVAKLARLAGVGPRAE